MRLAAFKEARLQDILGIDVCAFVMHFRLPIQLNNSVSATRAPKILSDLQCRSSRLPSKIIWHIREYNPASSNKANSILAWEAGANQVVVGYWSRIHSSVGGQN